MLSLTSCSWCGKEVGEMIGLKPCHICKESMSKGIAVIITAEDDPAFKDFFHVQDTLTHMGKYLSEWFVVNKKDFKKIMKKEMSPTMTKADINNYLKKGIFWVRETKDHTIPKLFPESKRLYHYKR